MPTLIPGVIAALVEQLPSAMPDGVAVVDGQARTADETPNTLYVGVSDPDAEDTPAGATAQQDWAHVGRPAKRDDSGSVFCTAVSWNGDDDPGAARVAAFATVAAVEDAVRSAADPSLGVDGVLWFGVTDIAMRQNRNSRGAECQVTFAVSYRGRV